MTCNNFYDKDDSKSKLSKSYIRNSTQDDDNNIKSSEPRVSTLPIDSIKIGKRFRCDLGDISNLAKSIQEVGLLHPIVVTKDYDLIAGQRRLEACKQLGWTEIPVHIVHLNEIAKGEFHENVIRKDFTYSEMVAIKRAIEPAEREQAKERQKEHGNTAPGRPKSNDSNYHHQQEQEQNTSANFAEVSSSDRPQQQQKQKHPQSREKVAGYVGISHRTLEKVEEIVEAAEQEPQKYAELLEMVDQKKIKVDKAYKQLQKQKKREELKNADPVIKLPDEGVKLLNGDFVEYTKDIPDNSIDLIFVDPPYGREYLFLYTEQAKLASRVLKEGASIVTYAGQHMLPEIHDCMRAAGLKCNHEFAVKLTGRHSMIYPKDIIVEWKPLLWYVKGEKANIFDGPISDFIVSAPPEKIGHDWEQSIVEAEHVISKLTVEGQIVLDHMMGFGTTGIAALKLGRKFIGIEKDAQTFERAKTRIGQLLQSLQNNHVKNGEDEDNGYTTIYKEKKNEKEEEH